MKIAHYIDHTALKPNTTEEQIRKLCAEAKEYGFASVCVNSTWVNLCASLLANADTKICTVVGFPLGANLSLAKAYEAYLAVKEGASEVDMVMNISALKSGNIELVKSDIRTVRKIVPSAILKVIIETCFLSNEEKITACQIAKKENADFVKTSTGFSGGGATVEDVLLMRRTIGDIMGVKASGGIRNFSEAISMIKAGATRLGCSAGVEIVRNETY